MTWNTKNINVLKEDHHKQYGREWCLGLDHYNFLKSLGIDNTHYFLDVGCGAMRTGIHVAPLVDRYVGIDGHLESLEAAEKYEIPMNKIDNAELYFDSNFSGDYGEFDFIFCFSLFIHLYDKERKQAIEFIKRHCHKDTKIIISHEVPEGFEDFKVTKHEQESELTEHKIIYYEVEYNK